MIRVASRRRTWIAVGAVALPLVAFAALSWIAGGPRNVYGLLRWGAWRLHEGALRVGDAAPDLALTALDGKTATRIADRVGRRPLVLVFGSFT